jgi:hypothetical protein
MSAFLARSILALIAAVGLVSQSSSFDAESRREGETCNTNSDCAGTLRCETGTCLGVASAPQSITKVLDAEESFQNGADVVRLTHLKYYSDLLAEYHGKTGIYPLQDKAAGVPVYVFVAHDWQRAGGTPPYKHSVASIRDWINELENGLGRPVDEYYDPQYASDGYKPNLYIYMVYRDTFFFAVHLYRDYPFTKKVAEHYNKLEISNKPNAQNRAADPERLFASEDFRSALEIPYKADFFKEREAKYLHFTKQQR